MILTATFEGQTTGTTPTTTNSSTYGDSAFGLVDIDSGSALTYDGSQSAHGSRSLKITPAASADTYVEWDFTQTFQYGVSFAFNLSSLPSVNTALGQGRASGAALGQIIVVTNGALYVATTNGGGSLGQSGAGIIAVNTWYRVDQFTTISASAGEITTRICALNSSTALWSQDTGTSANTGAAGPTAYRFGKLNLSGSLGTFWMDDLRFDTAATGLMGPYVPPPTIVSALYQPVSVIDLSASSGVGTLSYAIAGPTGGATQVANGIWRITVVGTYTVTTTDAGTGLTAVNTYVCDPFAGMIEVVTKNSDGTIT